MITEIVRWDVHPDKVQAYMAWAQTSIPRLLTAPGLVELRAYRPIIGNSQVVTVYEFPDLASWATWHMHAEVRRFTDERRTFTINEFSELWGVSPIWPNPMRPEGEVYRE